MDQNSVCGGQGPDPNTAVSQALTLHLLPVWCFSRHSWYHMHDFRSSKKQFSEQSQAFAVAY